MPNRRSSGQPKGRQPEGPIPPDGVRKVASGDRYRIQDGCYVMTPGRGATQLMKENHVPASCYQALHHLVDQSNWGNRRVKSFTYNWFAKQAGMGSHHTARKALQRLDELGIITISQAEERGRIEVQLHYLWYGKDQDGQDINEYWEMPRARQGKVTGKVPKSERTRERVYDDDEDMGVDIESDEGYILFQQRAYNTRQPNKAVR